MLIIRKKAKIFFNYADRNTDKRQLFGITEDKKCLKKKT